MTLPTLPPAMTLCSKPQGSDGRKRPATMGAISGVFACLIHGARLYQSAKQNEEAHTQNTHWAANL